MSLFIIWLFTTQFTRRVQVLWLQIVLYSTGCSEAWVSVEFTPLSVFSHIALSSLQHTVVRTVTNLNLVFSSGHQHAPSFKSFYPRSGLTIPTLRNRTVPIPLFHSKESHEVQICSVTVPHSTPESFGRHDWMTLPIVTFGCAAADMSPLLTIGKVRHLCLQWDFRQKLALSSRFQPWKSIFLYKMRNPDLHLEHPSSLTSSFLTLYIFALRDTCSRYSL